jgi:hypothetical protein
MSTKCEAIREKAHAAAGCQVNDGCDAEGRKKFNLAGFGANVKAALTKVDTILTQYGPTIEALTPAQAQPIEALVIALIHQASTIGNQAAPAGVTDPTALS